MTLRRRLRVGPESAIRCLRALKADAETVELLDVADHGLRSWR
jgi:hypothetical protein